LIANEVFVYNGAFAEVDRVKWPQHWHDTVSKHGFCFWRWERLQT